MRNVPWRLFAPKNCRDRTHEISNEAGRRGIAQVIWFQFALRTGIILYSGTRLSLYGDDFSALTPWDPFDHRTGYDGLYPVRFVNYIFWITTPPLFVLS